MELWQQTITCPTKIGLTLEFRLPSAVENMAAHKLRASLIAEQADLQDGLPTTDAFAALGETEARVFAMRVIAGKDKIDATYTLQILEQLRPLAVSGCNDWDSLFASDLLCEEAGSLWARVYFRGEQSAEAADTGSSGPTARSSEGSERGQEVQGLPDNVPSENVA